MQRGLIFNDAVFGGVVGVVVLFMAPEEVREVFEALPDEKQQVVLETLSLDARPAFHEKETRTYFFRIYELDVGWEIVEGRCVVCSIRTVDE